jgi:hypothetical protein
MISLPRIELRKSGNGNLYDHVKGGVERCCFIRFTLSFAPSNTRIHIFFFSDLIFHSTTSLLFSPTSSLRRSNSKLHLSLHTTTQRDSALSICQYGVARYQRHAHCRPRALWHILGRLKGLSLQH